MSSFTLERVMLRTIKTGLWAIPILPLYISSGMLFPFITGKNFFFRIMVEIILALWVGLAIAHPELRPRLTPLMKAVTIFMVILFMADLFGLNPYRSFFSNYERMEGFMMLFHLYLYFLMLASVFKTRRDWLVFFHVTLATSLIVSFIGFLQKLGLRVSLQGGFRVDSTIGNPTYLAAYLLFHVWLLVFLIREFWKKWWLVLLYAAALFFELLIIYFTATRGATLALIASAILFLASLVIFWEKIFPHRTELSSVRVPSPVWYKRGRNMAGAVLILFVIVPAVFWQLRNTTFIQNTQIVRRLTNYSLEERTIQSRFMIWKMSAQAVLDRPILGWGQENYYLVFQKYFNPGLYAQEPWFDRSHNVIFDWLVHAGILGLLSYLSILAAAFWSILRAAKNANFPLWPGLVIVAALTTHFLQNIFVFDNLNTYLLFFAILAYTDWLTFPYAAWSRPIPSSSKNVNRQREASRQTALGLSIGAGFLILVFIAGYSLHLKPMRESAALINALKMNQAQNSKPDDVLGLFKESLSYNTFGNTEVREQLASMARAVPENNRYTPEDQKKFVEFTIEEMRKEVSIPAKDIKHLLFLASILSRAQTLNPQYGQEAEKLLLEAIRLSPTKQIIYFELAQLYLTQNKVSDALAALEKVVGLEPGFNQAKVNLLIVASLAQRRDIVEKISPQINIMALDEDGLRRVGAVHMHAKSYKYARDAYTELTRFFPEKAEYHAVLAAILGELGEADRAIEEAKKAAALDPAFAKEAGVFIDLIKKQKQK